MEVNLNKEVPIRKGSSRQCGGMEKLVALGFLLARCYSGGKIMWALFGL